MDQKSLFPAGSQPEAEATKALPPRLGPKRLRSAVRNQIEFQQCALDDLLAEDHQARIVWSYVDSLDLAELFERIQAVAAGPGQAPPDPRILLSLWLYATLRGVGSARELNRLCQFHAAYRWICGGVSMNYHTLSDFRTGHVELLDRLLTESVASLMAEGLVTLDRVAQDGMKVRASAGAGFLPSSADAGRGVDGSRRTIAAVEGGIGYRSGGGQNAATGGPRACGRGACAAVRAALEQLPKIAESKKAKRSGKGAGLDDGCRRPRDEDGRRRFSSGI